MDGGKLKASTANVGSQTTTGTQSFKPIYISSGTFTAASATIGSANTPIWMDQGVFKVVTSINATASSASSYSGGAVGDEHTPIYLNSSGVPQATTDVFSNSKDNIVTGITTFNANVTMNSSVSADSLTAGSLVVSGNTSLVNTTNTATLLPHANNTYNIGSSSLKYKDVYATTFHGALDGTATRASHLPASQVGSASRPVYIDTNGDPQQITSLDVGSGAIKTTGTATLTTISSTTGTFKTLNVTTSGGSFNYGTIAATGSDNATWYLWMAKSDAKGVPKYNTNLSFNPSTNTLTVSKLSGTATYASKLTSTNVGSAGSTPTNDDTTSGQTGGVPVYFDSNGQPVAVNSIDGTKIIGMIPLKWIPKGALERMVVVATVDAMKALTSDSVQIGDTVRIATSATTDVDVLYYVIPLSDASTSGSDVVSGTNFAFVPYSAGSATNAKTADSAIAAGKLSSSITIYVKDNDSTNSTDVSTDFSGNVTLKLPATIKASITGNATSATSATTATTANGLAKYLTITTTDVAGSDTTKLNKWKAAANASVNISANGLFPKIAGTCTTSTTAGAWVDVTMTNAFSQSGSYMLQIKEGNNYWTGVFSYTTTNAASGDTDTDEILLHSAGTVADLYRIYARTVHVGGGAMKLQCSTDITTAKSLTITARQLI